MIDDLDAPCPVNPDAIWASGRDLAMSDESGASLSREMKMHGLAIEAQPSDPGQVSFQGGWTFHCAGANTSRRPRSVMTIINMEADMRVGDPANEMQRSDLAQWLPGLRPGGQADPALKPGLVEAL